MTSPDRILIIDGARTPVGSFGGVLKDAPAHELGATAAKAALDRAGVSPDAYNARRVALAAGLPKTTPAYTVNRLCGSGLQAVWSAAMQIQWGGLDLALAGGNDSMSRMPFYDFNARAGYKLGDRQLVDGTVGMLTDPFHGTHMGVTVENVGRQEQDEFALQSQLRAATDAAKAAFADEITPVEVGGRRPATITTDEHTKPETTLDTLGTLRAAFERVAPSPQEYSSGIRPRTRHRHHVYRRRPSPRRVAPPGPLNPPLPRHRSYR